MAATTFDLAIWIDGQTEPLRVVADQRDMAAFEVEHKRSSLAAVGETPMLLFRFIGTHAARRIGLVKADEFTAWLDTVIDVEPADGDEADPGSPAA